MDKKSYYTIEKLARAANVGIETVRYYQQRNLLPTLDSANATHAVYPEAIIDRLRFISSGIQLGFTVDEIHQLLQLADGSNRGAIQDVVNKAICEIRSKIYDLKEIERVLTDLLRKCEEIGYDQPCPIIDALQGPSAD